CISTWKECLRYLDDNIQEPMNSMARSIAQRLQKVNPRIAGKNILRILDKQAQNEEYPQALVRALEYIDATSQRSNGIGSASLSQKEVEQLMKYQKKLEKLFKDPTEANQFNKDFYMDKGVITDEFVELLWDAMPSVYHNRLKSKGSVPEGSWWSPDGLTLKPNNERGKLILKKFLQQDARDAYTGLPISLFNSDLEHIRPFSMFGSKAENPDNICLTSKSVNQTKGDKTIRKFFEEDIIPRSKWSKEQWEQDKIKKQQNQIKKNASKLLAEELAQNPDKINPITIKAMGSKSYYVLRELGITNYYWPSSGKPLQSNFTQVGLIVYSQSSNKETRAKVRDLFANISYKMSKSGGRSNSNGLGESKEQVWNETFIPELKKLGFDTDSIINDLGIKPY
ncbi:MAG: hypothetical protein R3321_09050, partial [Nitrososphaeraceae archaeon]|nr:hypothetical protein [Nitrososphaeraceae archaeon]